MPKVQLHAYILVLLLSLSILAMRIDKPLSIKGRPNTNFSKIPMQLDGWVATKIPVDEKTLKALPSASVLMRYYDDSKGTPINMTIVYGTDLGDFHQPEFCLEGQGHRSLSKGKVNIKDIDGQYFPAVSLITESDYSKQAFVYWFSSDNVNSTFLGNYKFKMLMSRLRGKRIGPSAMIDRPM